MIKRSKYSFLTNALSITLIASALLFVFIPSIEIFKHLSDYMFHAMIAYLMLGMILFVFNKRRIMFASLAACVILGIFLKTASNEHLVLPRLNNLPVVDIAHFNLANIQSNPDSLISLIKGLDPDIISFQEFTPDWDKFFIKYIPSDYEYFSKEVRIDPYGMCIFSKYPIDNASLYFHDEIPNYTSRLVKDDLTISLFSSYLLAPFQPSGRIDNKSHLQKIVNKVNVSPFPSIVMGDFNMVYWANEIMRFRADAELSNSRREVKVGNFKMPYDHLFFSNDLECTNFMELNDFNDNHIGIYGEYQLKSEELIDSRSSDIGVF